jgi:anthranilate phosphoribosyltransferase
MKTSEVIEQLRRREDLDRDAAASLMESIIRGEIGAATLGAILIALSMKGERPGELAGFVDAMRRQAVDPGIDPLRHPDRIDTCGTGGDRSGTFNISTASAIVVASCGVPVVKAGNRSVSSRCGSADVLEMLGIEVSSTPEDARRSLEQASIAFLFAQAFHPAVKNVAPVRRELGVPTAFNLIGPLSNPARPRRQVIGVPRPELTELLAETSLMLGSERVWVVHGTDGLDELSTTGRTRISEGVADPQGGPGTVRTFDLHPQDVGLPLAEPSDLLGGDAAANAAIILAVIEGRRGAPRDIVCLNAAAALLVAGVVASIQDGLERAGAAIDEGRALDTLARFRAASGPRP